MGYVGAGEACPILIGGLRRLEYRGYDSAGVATLYQNGRLEIRRAKGKLDNLCEMLARAPLRGRIGIGHTRWATHGRPSDENAHPHKAGPVAVIHNGIVENYLDLRAELLSRGHTLKSETDTELISHLVEERLKEGTGLTEAVRRAVGDLRGSFSIVVLSETDPDKLVAAKTATPLVIGLGDGENFVASDIPAILEHTRMTMVLDDGELAEVTSAGAKVMKFDGTPVERMARRIEWDSVAATKGGFPHYLRKEIAEQPQSWIDTMAGRATAGFSEVKFEGELLPATGPQAISRIVMLGAGASWITAQIGKFIIEDLTGIPVEVDYSSEFRYRRPPIDHHTVIIAVSQSGETADTLAVAEVSPGARQMPHRSSFHGFLPRDLPALQAAACDSVKRTGMCLIPARKFDRSRSTLPVISICLRRGKSACRVKRSSRRARCAPPQKCSPRLKARWSLGVRLRSKP